LEANDIRERNKEIMECWNIGRMEDMSFWDELMNP
jgi:hypothetical protein